jgi:hypothetical protein
MIVRVGVLRFIWFWEHELHGVCEYLEVGKDRENGRYWR